MTYIAKISAGGTLYPAVQYEALEDALAAVRDALRKGYFKVDKFTVQLGEGSILQVLSMKELNEQAADDRAAKASMGVLAPDRMKAKSAFKLIVQYMQMQFALDFPTEEDADAVVDRSLKTKIFEHEIKEGHDYLFLQTRAGTSYLKLSAEEYGQQLRLAQENAIRQAAAQQGNQPPPASRIIFP